MYHFVLSLRHYLPLDDPRVMKLAYTGREDPEAHQRTLNEFGHHRLREELVDWLSTWPDDDWHITFVFSDDRKDTYYQLNTNNAELATLFKLSWF